MQPRLNDQEFKNTDSTDGLFGTDGGTLVTTDYSYDHLNQVKIGGSVFKCSFAETVENLGFQNHTECGSTALSHQTCTNCANNQWYVHLDRTCEFKQSDINELNYRYLQDLKNPIFKLPNGSSLIIFNDPSEKNACPFSQTIRPSKQYYAHRTSNQGEPEKEIICLYNCSGCKTIEIKPTLGSDANLFCDHGHKFKKKQNAHSGNKRNLAIFRQKPQPDTFNFANHDSFPMEVKLPGNILKRSFTDPNTGERLQIHLKQAQINVFFDDTLMPFEIVNDQIVIQINKDPFERLNKPKEYDNMWMTVSVYLRHFSKQSGLDLTLPQTTLPETTLPGITVPDTKLPGTTLSHDLNAYTRFLKTGSSANGKESPVPLYQSSFKFIINPLTTEYASDSDAEEELLITKGIITKKRYELIDYLNYIDLNITLQSKYSLIKILQQYLKGGYFVGELAERKKIKDKRNADFIETIHSLQKKLEKDDKNNFEVTSNFVKKYIASYLTDVFIYYVNNCQQQKHFLQGLIQLLDISHALLPHSEVVFSNILKLNINQNDVFPSCKNFAFKFARVLKEQNSGKTYNTYVILRKSENNIVSCKLEEMQETTPAEKLFDVSSINDTIDQFSGMTLDDPSDKLFEDMLNLSLREETEKRKHERTDDPSDHESGHKNIKRRRLRLKLVKEKSFLEEKENVARSTSDSAGPNLSLSDPASAPPNVKLNFRKDGLFSPKSSSLDENDLTSSPNSYAASAGLVVPDAGVDPVTTCKFF